jgi:hypothetical protein
MAPMKFGLALPPRNPRVTAAQAQMAEAAGWDGVFLGDAIWTVDPMVALAAAAMVTERIRLGTMVIPMPIRRPSKVASESLALDRLSDGRLILGIGAGAVWMGWQSFPDEKADTRARAEMLDESIDLLNLFWQAEPFAYEGKHNRVNLSWAAEHGPGKPVQQPRIPLWVPGLWPRPASMRRVLRCDGVLVEKLDAEGQNVTPTPDDVRAIAAYVAGYRTLETPFDIVVNGETAGMDAVQRRETLQAWAGAGATWWIEGAWNATDEELAARIEAGVPDLLA